MRLWALVALMGIVLSGVFAQHEYDLLFGAQEGRVAIIQPQPHPVRTMSSVFGNFILDVGMDFYFENGVPHLQSCRVQQVWISPNLTGTRSGIGNVFCSQGCQNYFDLPTFGTPHHHFIFATNQAGVYAWDVRAIQAVAHDGTPLADMESVYRVYMVAGNPRRLFGSVQPAPTYQARLYDLFLTVQLRQNGTILAQQTQPPNPDAIYAYMVGFTQPADTYTVVAKLDKHLSRRADGVALSGASQLDWNFHTVGDVNNDDVIDDADLLQVLFAFGSSDPTSDVNGDGVVDDADLLVVLFNFGAVGEGSQ